MKQKFETSKNTFHLKTFPLFENIFFLTVIAEDRNFQSSRKSSKKQKVDLFFWDPLLYLPPVMLSDTPASLPQEMCPKQEFLVTTYFGLHHCVTPLASHPLAIALRLAGPSRAVFHC